MDTPATTQVRRERLTSSRHYGSYENRGDGNAQDHKGHDAPCPGVHTLYSRSVSDVHPSSDQTALIPVGIGTAIWLIALLGVSLVSGATPPPDGVWWWGVCLIGTLSGVIGLVFLNWRRSRIRRSRTKN
jgi:hypothetical protein